MAAGPSDATIETAIREILEGAKLDDITHGIIRNKLEERFSVDLTPRKAAIKALTLTILSEKSKAEEEEGGGEEEEEEEEQDDEDDDDEEEEEEEKARGSKKRRRGGGGFAAMVQWSDKMAEFLGTDEMPRTQVTKFLWSYIKERDLQKPGDKRIILCDDALQKLFGVKSINMLQMPKAVNKHAYPTDGGADDDDDDDDDEEGSKERKKKPAAKKVKKEAPKKDKVPKKSNMPQMKLSSELQAVLGQATASRPEVTKLLWVYIKANDLQNPNDKRQILCDGLLRKVFEQESVNMFTMNKLIGKHLLGRA